VVGDGVECNELAGV